MNRPGRCCRIQQGKGLQGGRGDIPHVKFCSDKSSAQEVLVYAWTGCPGDGGSPSFFKRMFCRRVYLPSDTRRRRGDGLAHKRMPVAACLPKVLCEQRLARLNVSPLPPIPIPRVHAFIDVFILCNVRQISATD